MTHPSPQRLRASERASERAPERAPDLVVARSRGELAKALAVTRTAPDGSRRSIGFVPTMGALHEGHRALIRRARELADEVVVSIFVNPLQFGPAEDLDRYPRTLDADLEACAAEGVALVFAPTPDVVYPADPRVTVSPGGLGDRFEGASRPGHFSGVLTVVAKLFNLVAPDVAVFGEKDYQQLALIRQLVADLDIPVHVVGLPTVREADGLALSSRNRYLSAEQRRAAAEISRALRVAADETTAADVLAAARTVLEAEPGLVVDYLALVDADTLDDFDGDPTRPARLLVAAYAGSTRLIDNYAIVIGE